MRAVREFWITDANGTAINLADLIDGFSAKEPFNGPGSVVGHTFTEPMRGLVVSNDSASDLTVTLLGMTFTVKAGEVFEETFEPFTTVDITTAAATDPWRAYGRN